MRILFIDGTKGFSPTRLLEKPSGGIITSLTIIPRELAKAGHDVTVMSLYDATVTAAGVKHVPLRADVSTLPVPDVVVFNRNCIERPIAKYFKDRGARIVWWLHDIVDPRYLPDDGFRLADTIVALSRYCRDSYSDFYGIDSSLFTVIPNGVDKSVFHLPLPKQVRRSDLFVTASAPVKGLYPLGFAWHNIKRAVPGAELRLYSSQGLHDFENSPEHQRQLDALVKDGAKLMDPVPQYDLADVFREATALLMPNNYPEICSNILLQAQACGLPVVASSIGSAQEFIEHGETGMLTHTSPSDMFWWHKDFAEQCVMLAMDRGLREYISAKAADGVWDWERVVNKWRDMLAFRAEPAAVAVPAGVA